MSTEGTEITDRLEDVDLRAYAVKTVEWVHNHPRKAATLGLGGLLLLNPATALAVVMTVFGFEVRKTIAGSLAANIRKEVTPALRDAFLDFTQSNGTGNESISIEHSAIPTESQGAHTSKTSPFSDPGGWVKKETKARSTVHEDVHRMMSKGEDEESRANEKKVMKDGETCRKILAIGSESASHDKEEGGSIRHGRPKL
ncbi:MAG: hypothetical protein Q9174_002531 [Haloplaca sp. 1 TL-2023]